MVPESHEISFQTTEELRAFLISPDFSDDVRVKLMEQYEVDVSAETTAQPSEEGVAPNDRLILSYTRNNAGGIKDAIDYLVSRLVTYGLDATTVKGAIPRPKSDSFQDSLPFFDSKLLHHAPGYAAGTDSPTHHIYADDASERGSIFGRLRKPGSMSSFSSFIGRKNQSGSPGSFFKHASSNASKASLVSMESRDSVQRNPWNDSGINLPDDDSHGPGNGWPNRFDHKLMFGSTAPGDITPRHDLRTSFDSGRPSTSNSTSGYPAPIGPPR